MRWGLLLASVGLARRPREMDTYETKQLLNDPETTLVLAISANTPTCPYCLQFDEAYHTSVDKLTQKLPAPLEDGQGHKVVFGHLDVMRNRDIAQLLNIDAVPKLFVFDGDLKCKDTCRHTRRDLLIHRGNLAPPAIMQPVLEQLGRRDVYERYLHKKPWLTKKKLVAAAATIVLVAVPFSHKLAAILNTHMYLVGMLSTAIFLVSTSGVMYNWQNNYWTLFGPPENRYIHPAGRSQYLGEGLLMAYVNVVVSAAMLGVVHSLRKRASLKSVAGCAVLFLVAVGCFWYLANSVQIKTPYLRYSMFPPDDNYVRGSPRNDRHYTI